MTKHNRLLDVPIDELRPFPLNPRRIQNREYIRLRDSILNRGVEVPFVVSKIPGDSHYTLQAGGNTRLEIIQSLRERDARRFKKVPCILKTWHGETDALIAHLQENEIRGDLLFIEKAQAVMELHAMLKRELNKRTLTQREFARYLRERGYSISQTLISFMEYAVRRLYPVLPVALDSGLSKSKVQQIRTLERSAKNIWNRSGGDSADGPFTDLFDTLCGRHDQIDWSFEELKDDVVNELLQETNLDLHTIKWMLEERFEGRESSTIETSNQLEPDIESEITTKNNVHRTDSTGSDVQKVIDWIRPINQYRRKMADAALEIANEFDLAFCIKRTEGVGLGYVMVDIPTKRASRTSILIWKFLASCCEQARFSKQMLDSQLNQRSRLYRQIQSSRLSTIYGGFPSVDLFDTFPKLRLFIGNSCWPHIVELVTSYACVAQISNEHSVNLWETNQ